MELPPKETERVRESQKKEDEISRAPCLAEKVGETPAWHLSKQHKKFTPQLHLKC